MSRVDSLPLSEIKPTASDTLCHHFVSLTPPASLHANSSPTLVCGPYKSLTASTGNNSHRPTFSTESADEALSLNNSSNPASYPVTQPPRTQSVPTTLVSSMIEPIPCLVDPSQLSHSSPLPHLFMMLPQETTSQELNEQPIAADQVTRLISSPSEKIDEKMVPMDTLIPQESATTSPHMHSPLSLQHSPRCAKSSSHLASHSITMSLDLAAIELPPAGTHPREATESTLNPPAFVSSTSKSGNENSDETMDEMLIHRGIPQNSNEADTGSLSAADISSDLLSVPLSSTFSRQSSLITNATTLNMSSSHGAQQVRHPSEDSGGACTLDMFSVSNDGGSSGATPAPEGIVSYSSMKYSAQPIMAHTAVPLPSETGVMMTNANNMLGGPQDGGRPGSSHTNPSTSSLGMSPQLLCSPSFRGSKPSGGGCSSQESSSLSGSTAMEDECSPPKHLHYSQHPPIAPSHMPPAPSHPEQSSAPTSGHHAPPPPPPSYPNMMMMPGGYPPHPSYGSWAIHGPPATHYGMMASSQPAVTPQQTPGPSAAVAPYLHAAPPEMSSVNSAPAVARPSPSSSSHQQHRKHPCSHCDKVFDSKSQLKTHSQMHEPGNKFPCRYPGCERSFKSDSYLQNHVRCVHHKNKNIQCCHCDFNTTKKKQFNSHITRVHKDCVVPCAVTGCFYRFHNEHELRKHMDNEHLPYETSVKCTLCPQLCSSSQQLAAHMETAHRGHNASSVSTKTASLPGFQNNNNNNNNNKVTQSLAKRSFSSVSDDVYDFHNSGEMDFTEFAPSKKGRLYEASTTKGFNCGGGSGSGGAGASSSLDDILENIVQGNCQVRTPAEPLNSNEQTVAEESLEDEDRFHHLQKEESKELAHRVGQTAMQQSSSQPQQQQGQQQGNMMVVKTTGGAVPQTSPYKTVPSGNAYHGSMNYPASQHSSMSDCSMAFTSGGQLSCVTSSHMDTGGDRSTGGGGQAVMGGGNSSMDFMGEFDDFSSLLTDEQLANLEQQSVFSSSTPATLTSGHHGGGGSGTTPCPSSLDTVASNFTGSYHSNSQPPLSNQSTQQHAVTAGNHPIPQDHLRSLSSLGDKFLGSGGQHSIPPHHPIQQQHPTAQQQQPPHQHHQPAQNNPANLMSQHANNGNNNVNPNSYPYSQPAPPPSSASTGGVASNPPLPDMRSWAASSGGGPPLRDATASGNAGNGMLMLHQQHPHHPQAPQQLPQSNPTQAQAQQLTSHPQAVQQVSRRPPPGAGAVEMMPQVAAAHQPPHPSQTQQQQQQQQGQPQQQADAMNSYHPTMHRSFSQPVGTSGGVPPGMMCSMRPGGVGGGGAMGSMSAAQAQQALFMQRQQSMNVGAPSVPYMHPHNFTSPEQQQEYFYSMQKQRAAALAAAAANGMGGYGQMPPQATQQQHHPGQAGGPTAMPTVVDGQLLNGAGNCAMPGSVPPAAWGPASSQQQQAAMLMHQQRVMQQQQQQMAMAGQMRPMKPSGPGAGQAGAGFGNMMMMNPHPSFYYNQGPTENMAAMQFYSAQPTGNYYPNHPGYPSAQGMQQQQQQQHMMNPRMSMPPNVPSAPAGGYSFPPSAGTSSVGVAPPPPAVPAATAGGVPPHPTES